MPRKATILVVEDDLVPRKGIRKLLELEGHTVLEADSADGARKLWTTEMARIDLLITDVGLSDPMDGYRLGLQFQREKPGLKVIYSTGERQLLSQAGTELREGHNLLVKLYDAKTLILAVRRNLGEP